MKSAKRIKRHFNKQLRTAEIKRMNTTFSINSQIKVEPHPWIDLSSEAYKKMMEEI